MISRRYRPGASPGQSLAFVSHRVSGSVPEAAVATGAVLLSCVRAGGAAQTLPVMHMTV